MFIMMTTKLMILCSILRLTFAEPRLASPPLATTDDLAYQLIDSFSNPNFGMVPSFDKIPIIYDLITNLIGYKGSALNLAVQTIQWFVTNWFMVASGALAAVGLCKFTNLCNLNYEEYAPIRRFRSLVTSDHLDAAENFIKNAIDKYTEANRGRNFDNVA